VMCNHCVAKIAVRGRDIACEALCVSTASPQLAKADSSYSTCSHDSFLSAARCFYQHHTVDGVKLLPAHVR
jgi:hypothetical protein